MKIKIGTRTVASLLVAVVAALTLATCGKVKAPNGGMDAPPGSDAPSGSGACTWDQGTWDSCTFAP
ncbi:MAG: hypothetical protein ACM31C_04575 [Acidobacteriota bacterium]